MIDRKKKSLVILVFLAALLLVRPATPTTAQFVIATWDWPDEYGQGIKEVYAYENSTGSWLYPWGGDEKGGDYDNLVGFEWNVSVGIRLYLVVHVNQTLTGAVDLADGKNYHRENITVYDRRDNIVFSQNNLTYYDGGDTGDILQYDYYVTLEFTMLEGEAYTILITCEIYYLEE